ncbi:MAG: chorismate synthase [Lachnospiraceae bacterium]|nr:chorismate synthase [Lachnospiraceae bacterium]
MAGSSLGTIFRISTWGETHGKGVGVVIDGVPAGLELCEEDIQIYLDRRKPGQSKFVSPRKESDLVEILSGVFEGKTTGTPISLIVMNKNQRSKDYSNIMNCYRPGHADFTFDAKYGFRDYRGGGRSSARETIGRVAAGAVAAKILKQIGIEITTYAKTIGGISVDMNHFDKEEIKNNPFYMPDKEAAAKVAVYAEKMMQDKNSIGGIVECCIQGVPAGIGDPVFEKISANLGKSVFSIGAVKGFEIGDGFAVADSNGAVNNDDFCIHADGKVAKKTNHSGGTLGGITDGSPIVFRAAFKPTPSIAQVQNTVNSDMEEVQIEITGRHDPIIVPRAVVVVEAMAAITILDALLLNMTARLDYICDFYNQ